MKRLLSLIAISALCTNIVAQDTLPKPLQKSTTPVIKTDSGYVDKNGWTRGGLVSINLTQVGNSNWIAASGDKFSLSLAGSLNLFANRQWGRKSWENALEVNYALMNTSTLGVRKLNDRLDFITKYGYQPKTWKKTRFAALAQLRSQLSNGYQYDYFESNTRRRTSGFFAPAYITVAPIGVDWRPNSWFSLYGSLLAARWTIVTNGPYSFATQGGIFHGHVETPLATLYGVNPDEPNKGEFGAFVTATLRKDIMKNVNYYSKLDLYSDYLGTPKNIDVFWTNQLRMKVNKWIQVSYTLDMLYDDDVRNVLMPARPLGLQVLSTLGVGLAIKK